ncbi:hypothetical protein C8R44DRAFT_731059 [Mycena epipterygia]|nr:hypothetical protein C8R44DRAFT_731059 [Mycena epipterygia]
MALVPRRQGKWRGNVCGTRERGEDSSSHTALAESCRLTLNLFTVATAPRSAQYRVNGRFASRPPPEQADYTDLPPPPRTPSPLFREVTHPAGTPRHPTAMNADDGSSSNPMPNGNNGLGNPPPVTSEQRLANVESQLQALLDALTISAANPAPAPAVVQAPPPLVVTPQVATPQFTPPIAPLDSAAGASPSLRALFPDIEPACITSAITHDLKASDLYKLDTRVKESEPTYSLGASGTFEMNVAKHKAYKNLNSVLFPLHTYFAILTAHLPARTGATAYFYRYLTHLSTLASEYEWAVVLEYHTLYFNRRRNDMLAGVLRRMGHLGHRALKLARLPPPQANQRHTQNFQFGQEDPGLTKRALPELQRRQVRQPMRLEAPAYMLGTRVREGPSAHATLQVGARPDE